MIWLKSKIYLIGGALLAVLAFFVRFQVVKSQRDSAREKANHYDAEAKSLRVAKKENAKVRKEFYSRRVEARKEIKDGKVPDNLSDPDNF